MGEGQGIVKSGGLSQESWNPFIHTPLGCKNRMESLAQGPWPPFSGSWSLDICSSANRLMTEWFQGYNKVLHLAFSWAFHLKCTFFFFFLVKEPSLFIFLFRCSDKPGIVLKFLKTPVAWFGDCIGGLNGLTFDRALYLKTAFHHSNNKLSTFFKRIKPTIKNPFLCWFVQGCHTQPSLPDKLQEFRNVFFTADSLSQKLPSPHFLWPLSSCSQGLSLFSLGQTLPSWSFICLFPPHLSFTRPWWMAPCPLSCSVTLSFSLPLGRSAVFLCCVTLSKFFNLSEPVSPLVFFFFNLLSTLVCAGCCVKHRYQKDK